MSITRKVLAAATTLTAVCAVGTIGTLSADAATPACGKSCVEVFSRELGTPAQPNFVETVDHGIAEAGQPTILKAASNSDPSEDLIAHGGTVSDFYAAGLVSAAVNSHYGSLHAVQLEYAPSGVPSGLCAGLAMTAYQNEGLSLQRCSVGATAVWIIDIPDSTAPGYFPIMAGSTTDFTRPYVMTYPRGAFPTDSPTPRIHVGHLEVFGADHAPWSGWGHSFWSEHSCWHQSAPVQPTVPDRQLWGTDSGVVMQ